MKDGKIEGCTVNGDCILCVFDDPEYRITDCSNAEALADEGKGRDDCQYWKPTSDKDIVANELTALRAKVEELTAANLDLNERVLYAERERDELKGRIDAGLMHNCNICGAKTSVSIAADGSGKSITYTEETQRLTAELARKGAKPSDSDVCEWVQVSPSGIKQLHWWGACGMSGLYVGEPSGTCLCGGKIKVKEAK